MVRVFILFVFSQIVLFPLEAHAGPDYEFYEFNNEDSDEAISEHYKYPEAAECLDKWMERIENAENPRDIEQVFDDLNRMRTGWNRDIPEELRRLRPPDIEKAVLTAQSKMGDFADDAVDNASSPQKLVMLAGIIKHTNANVYGKRFEPERLEKINARIAQKLEHILRNHDGKLATLVNLRKLVKRSVLEDSRRLATFLTREIRDLGKYAMTPLEQAFLISEVHRLGYDLRGDGEAIIRGIPEGRVKTQYQRALALEGQMSEKSFAQSLLEQELIEDGFAKGLISKEQYELEKKRVRDQHLETHDTQRGIYARYSLFNPDDSGVLADIGRDKNQRAWTLFRDQSLRQLKYGLGALAGFGTTIYSMVNFNLLPEDSAIQHTGFLVLTTGGFVGGVISASGVLTPEEETWRQKSLNTYRATEAALKPMISEATPQKRCPYFFSSVLKFF
jgi:hypothetical protein